jgi:ubiquitin-like modifier-activating enzyme ATG7
MTSLLQHPSGVLADAPKSPSSDRDPPEHPLGLVPHQIRGYISTFSNLVIRGESYKNCSACSPTILDAYRTEGWEFVKKALLEKDYVSELSGLAEIQRMTEELDLTMDWDDEEGEGQDEGDGELL